MLHQHFYGCSVGFALVCIITFFAYIVAKKFREIPFPTLNRMYWRLATGHLLNQNHYMWEWSFLIFFHILETFLPNNIIDLGIGRFLGECSLDRDCTLLVVIAQEDSTWLENSKNKDTEDFEEGINQRSWRRLSWVWTQHWYSATPLSDHSTRCRSFRSKGAERFSASLTFTTSAER